MILDAASRAILDFEQAWVDAHPTGSTSGKDTAVRAALGYPLTRYYQLLGRLIDDAGASAAYPHLCARLRRIRDDRARARNARTTPTPHPYR